MTTALVPNRCRAVEGPALAPATVPAAPKPGAAASDKVAVKSLAGHDHFSGYLACERLLYTLGQRRDRQGSGREEYEEAEVELPL